MENSTQPEKPETAPSFGALAGFDVAPEFSDSDVARQALQGVGLPAPTAEPVQPVTPVENPVSVAPVAPSQIQPTFQLKGDPTKILHSSRDLSQWLIEQRQAAHPNEGAE